MVWRTAFPMCIAALVRRETEMGRCFVDALVKSVVG